MTCAFDIETLGLLHTKPLPPITCVCLCASNGSETRLRFWKVSPADFTKNKESLFAQLDAAERIAGFNAVHFDLEYIRVFFQVEAERVCRWILKCVDPYMVCKYILKNTCGLNRLLELNHLGSKTGSGEDAIELAMQERWEDLLDYCMMDARLTLALCCLPRIAFSPSLRGYMDAQGLWRFCVTQNVYSQKSNTLSLDAMLR